MKKLLILSLFVVNYSFAQSLTILPTTDFNLEVLKFKKNGIGLDHRSFDETVGVGTYADISGGFIQTHTDHPLRFSTNNTNAQMTLLKNGNFGIGNINPAQKLNVTGNGYFSGNLNTDGLFSADTLSVGGGTPINKFIKVKLKNMHFLPQLLAKSCSEYKFFVTGVEVGDTVILNVETPNSLPLIAANVRASDLNRVEVKFCNIGNQDISTSLGLDLSFTVIK